MKKVLFITTTPTIGGNGDTLIETAMSIARAQGVDCNRIDVRNMHINPCKACYACRSNGICAQKDDFINILSALHECDGIIAEAPIYYNCMAAQTITMINRLCCTFAYPAYPLGPQKKIGIFLTCTGSLPEEMKHHVDLILTLPSLQRSITEYKTEVFTGCNASSKCKDTEEYLERARTVGKWIVE